jgi:hypothetical protein
MFVCVYFIEMGKSYGGRLNGSSRANVLAFAFLLHLLLKTILATGGEQKAQLNVNNPPLQSAAKMHLQPASHPAAVS